MKIAEVSKQFNLSNDTLRYYEKIGLMGPVKRNKSGVRDYQKEDLGRIRFIKCMRQAGLSIEAIQNYIALFDQGDQTIPTRLDILYKEREKLELSIASLQETLQFLNNKIDTYHEHMKHIKP